MWCPSCGAEYRPGFTHCPDCDVDLVADAPPEPEPDPPRVVIDMEHLGPGPVQAYSGRRIDSELVRALLEASGIRSVVWGTGTDQVPETGAPGLAARVMVGPSDLERARELIDSANVGDLDLGPELEEEWDIAGGEEYVTPEVDLGSAPFEVWTGRRADAEMVQSLLEEDGIGSAIWDSDGLDLPEGLDTGDMVRVMTHLDDAARAIDVIDAAGAGELDQGAVATRSSGEHARAWGSGRAGQPSAIEDIVPWWKHRELPAVLRGIRVLFVLAAVLGLAYLAIRMMAD